MLARGELLSVVLASFLGTCSAGRAALAMWLQHLSGLPTLHSRRQELEHFLRTFEGARLHGSQWRVIDAAGYVGRQHELAPKMVEIVDPETGELREVETNELKRKHVPSKSAGGLAAHQDRSPRQLNRHRARLREGRIIASTQPPPHAPDAKKPRHGDGRWAYAQIWLVLPPTPQMLARWKGPARRPAPRPTVATGRAWTAQQPPRVDDLWGLRQLVDEELSGPRQYRD